MGDPSTDGACSSQCERLTYFASIAALVLLVVNAGLILANRGTQDEIGKTQTQIAERSAKIQQNAAFENINRSLIQALANAAVNKKDAQIKALLVENGVTLDAPPKAAQ